MNTDILKQIEDMLKEEISAVGGDLGHLEEAIMTSMMSLREK